MMNKMEAQIIVENTGNYCEEDIEYIMDTYEELLKHIGFEDKRSDKRFIVKFHDIMYHTPDEYTEEHQEEFWHLFDEFCDDQYEYIKEANKEQGIDEEMMLTRYNCGHYPAFTVDIPEITKDNAIDLAMDIYEEEGYRGPEYVKDYIFMVNTLQDLEDNYMDYWIDFVEGGEYMPEQTIKEMKENYKSYKERNK